MLSILDSKARQNDERVKVIQERVRELVGKASFFVAGESVETGEIDVWNVDQDKRVGTTFSTPYNGGTYYAGYTIRHYCEIVEYDDEAGFIA